MIFMAPHPPMVVPRSRDLLLGRSAECDFPVPSRGASREHAKVYFRDDDVMIEDLGSTNGTFVNEERIEGEQVLKPGDRINIGGAVLTFCHVLRQMEAGASADCDKTVMFERPPTQDVEQELFRGDLSQIPVAAVLQLLAEGMKSGMLRVAARQESARCWLEDGRPVHAETAGLEGLEAIFHIIGLLGGRFVFDDTRAPPSRTITMSMTEVLLEASRLRDEAAAGASSKR
jgi:hypothetical protein